MARIAVELKVRRSAVVTIRDDLEAAGRVHVQGAGRASGLFVGPKTVPETQLPSTSGTDIADRFEALQPS